MRWRPTRPARSRSSTRLLLVIASCVRSKSEARVVDAEQPRARRAARRSAPVLLKEEGRVGRRRAGRSTPGAAPAPAAAAVGLVVDRGRAAPARARSAGGRRRVAQVALKGRSGAEEARVVVNVRHPINRGGEGLLRARLAPEPPRAHRLLERRPRVIEDRLVVHTRAAPRVRKLEAAAARRRRRASRRVALHRRRRVHHILDLEEEPAGPQQPGGRAIPVGDHGVGDVMLH